MATAERAPKKQAAPKQQTTPEDEATASAPVAEGPVDDLTTTQHVLTIGRRKLKYTATTGRIVLRQEVLTEGKFDGHLPKAEVFLTAYTLDDADASERKSPAT